MGRVQRIKTDPDDVTVLVLDRPIMGGLRSGWLLAWDVTASQADPEHAGQDGRTSMSLLHPSVSPGVALSGGRGQGVLATRKPAKYLHWSAVR